MVKGASGNLQKEKIINKRKHAGRRPIGIKYFEARMVYRLRKGALSGGLKIYFFPRYASWILGSLIKSEALPSEVMTPCSRT